MNVMDFLNSLIAKKTKERIAYLSKNLDKITEKEREQLESLYGVLVRTLGISESAKWCINWKVDKFNNKEEYEQNKPYETCCASQNIILDAGANHILKLIGGIDNATPFDNKNAQIGVGNDTTPENANQTGLMASSTKFYKKVEAGYPQVSGRTITYKATYDTNEANFAWNEFSIVNGVGVGNTALNRKVQSLGTKVTGIWSLQITISVTSNN